MKHLLLLRHAKSSWAREGLEDHARPLNARGRRDAPRMGRLLAELGLRPQRVLLSDSARTLETARLLLPAAGATDADQCPLRDLYHAPPARLVETIQAHGGDADVLLVIAHNPGLEALVARADPGAGPFPTAALAILENAIDAWSALDAARPGHLHALYRPKALPQVPGADGAAGTSSDPA